MKKSFKNICTAGMLSAAVASTACSEKKPEGSQQVDITTESQDKTQSITDRVSQISKDLNTNNQELKVSKEKISSDSFWNLYDTTNASEEDKNIYREDYKFNPGGLTNPYAKSIATNISVNGNPVIKYNPIETPVGTTNFSTLINNIISENYTNNNDISPTIKESYKKGIDTTKNIDIDASNITIQSVTRPLPDDYEETNTENLDISQAESIANGFKDAILSDMENIEYENGTISLNIDGNDIEISPVVIPYSNEELGYFLRVSEKIYGKGNVEQLLKDYLDNPQQVESALAIELGEHSYANLTTTLNKENSVTVKINGLEMKGTTVNAGRDYLSMGLFTVGLLLILMRKKLYNTIKNKTAKTKGTENDTVVGEQTDIDEEI